MVYPLSGTVWERELMTNPTRLIAGAFVAAAVAVPIYAAAVSTDSTEVTATPACLAWYGNKDDGKCLSYSNGQPVNVGTPVYNGGNGPNAGWSSGPLLPGTTISRGIG
jgi:hypothetical protein